MTGVMLKTELIQSNLGLIKSSLIFRGTILIQMSNYHTKGDFNLIGQMEAIQKSYLTKVLDIGE